MRVWIVKEWYVYPVAWILAGGNYIRNLEELHAKVLAPAFAGRASFTTLHILSHGNTRLDPQTGSTLGHYIEMGGADRIDTDDFDPNGSVRYGTKTARLIDLLRWVIAPQGRLIFSACGQGDGALLRLISNHLKSSITVSGFRGLGHPFRRGNIAFRNGEYIR